MLERLTEEVDRFEAELDEAVFDVCHRNASDRVNTGEYDDSLDFMDGFDTVHDEADHAASEVNNGGPAQQVTFLSALCRSEEDLLALLGLSG